MNKYRHLLITTLIIIFVVLFSAGIWLYNTEKKQTLNENINTIEAIAKLKVSRITEWINARKSHAFVMMASRYYNPLAEKWETESPAEADVRNVLEGFEASKEYYRYDDALFVNRSGKAYFRLDPEGSEPASKTLEALADAFKSNNVIFSDPYISDKENYPRLDLVVPFFATVGSERVPTGAVIYQYSTRHLMLDIWPAPSKSAETMLVKRDDDSMLLLNNLRHIKNAALNYRIPINQKDSLSGMAASGKTGKITGKDYRGKTVLAAVKFIPDMEWFLITKIDKTEVLLPLRENYISILIAFLLSIAFTFTIITVAWQRKEKSHYRSLFEAESALRKNEIKYRSILDSMMEGFQIIDFQWRYTYLNATAVRYSGLSEEKLLGRSLFEMFPGIENTPVFRAFKRCMTERKPQTIISELKYPECISAWYIFSIQPVTEGIFVLSMDITDSKIMEKENLLLAATIEQSSEIITIYDVEGKLKYVNPAFEKITGYTKEEAKEIFISGGTEGTSYSLFRRNLPEILHSRKEWKDRYTSQKKDGSFFTVEETVWPVFDSAGNIINYVSLKRDVSEQEKLEKDKESLQSQLLQSQKLESVGRLAGGIAHDFNNMLNVILGHAQLSLMEINPDNPLFSGLSQIEKAARRSAELTQQLLAFARKQTISPKAVNLNSIISEHLKILQRLIGEDIEILWKPCQDLWSIYVDPTRMNQIFTNMAINSRDAIKKSGKIIIETRNIVIDELFCSENREFVPGDYVVVTFSDNGRGMEKEILERIFEPFFTTKGVGEGTGLGLSTVFGIVKQSNGFINAYSEPGMGAVFRIYFPRFSDQPEEDKEINSIEDAKEGNETILLVEDEVTVKDLVELMLKKLGYNVFTAISPSEALQIIEEQSDNIQMMIVDVVMPEMTGRELVDSIQTLMPDLKCLFMSGYTSDIIANRGVIDSGVHFIEKPFSLKDLSEKIRELLDS